MKLVILLWLCITKTVQDTCTPSNVKWQTRNLYFLNTDILSSDVLRFPNLPACVDYCGSISYNQIVHYDEATTSCICFNIATKHLTYTQRLVRNHENEKMVVMQIRDESEYRISNNI